MATLGHTVHRYAGEHYEEQDDGSAEALDAAHPGGHLSPKFPDHKYGHGNKGS